MKRKFLSILLTLAMALTLLPVSAMAEETPVEAPAETKVAKVGNDEYETLQAAVNATTTENSTVTLLKDVTEDITIPTGVTAMLDLSGKTLTNKAGKHTITVENGGKLNISDSVGTGVVDNTSHGKAAIYNKGEVTLNGGTFERSAEKGTYSPYSNGGNSWYTIANYGTMEINTGVTVENAGGYSSMIRNGGDVTADCNLTIEGGNFAGGVNTVKNDSFGVLTINGGNFSNTAQYVIMNWNKAEITAGTFQTLDTASAVLFTSAYGADANTVGKLTISGGEFKHASDTQEMIVDHYDESNSGAAAVTGGRFDADISKYIPSDYVQSADGTVEKLGESNAVAKIGGTYYKTLPEAVAAAQSGETVKLLHDIDFGTDRLTIKKAITLDLAGHKITTNNSVCTLYFTKTATVTDSVGNGKIENTYGTANGIGIVSGGEDADLTLNGVTVSGYYGVFIQQGANVTVINSNIKAIFCGIAVLGQNDSNKKNTSVIVKSGTVEGGDYAIAGNGTMQGTEITITGGTIRETGNNGGGAIYHPQNGTLSISGDALIEGENGIQLCSGEGVIANITGGVIRATGNDQRASKTGDGFIPDGAALSIVNRDYPGGTPKMNVSGGYFAAEKNNAVLAYTWSANKASEWTNAKEYLSINGGLFSSDPSDYVAAGHYVDASNNGDYPYTVKEGTKPAGALIVVKDKTDTAVGSDITGNDENAINGVISKANVDGVAEAVTPAKKADIVSKSNANPGDNDKVEIEVAVKVEAKTADLANGKLTFEASPVATVKVNGATKGTTVPVTNDMLNGQPITVKLPLPTVDGKLFTPKQILHKFTGGGYEYFINKDEDSKRGAGSFKIEDGCAVFTIYGFSTFELSGTVTYVEPSSGGGSSSSSRRYDVSAPSVTHGDVTVSPKTASKGDTVTITVKPDSGYVLETLTVTDKNGDELTLKDKGSGKYTFTMPAGKVEVKATFMEDNSMLNFFYDVPNGAYFYEAVKWAVENGITTGVGNDLFAPEQPCTRAQIVTFLWRAAGSPEPKSTAAGMTDVVPGSYYAKAVAWAVENGITTGTAEGTFSPDATCTRAQAVTFLARAQNAKATGKTAFSDVPADSYFADAVAWAQANGVTTGTSETTFSPDNDCTRAQIVTFLYRANQGT